MSLVIKRNNQVLVSDVKKRLSDIDLKISWSEIVRDYFYGKSMSWFYHKLDGIDGNGGKGGFTQEELEILKGGLVELSNKIRAAADRL